MKSYQFALLVAFQFGTWVVIALLGLGEASEQFWSQFGSAAIWGMVLMMGLATVSLAYHTLGQLSIDDLRERVSGGDL